MLDTALAREPNPVSAAQDEMPSATDLQQKRSPQRFEAADVEAALAERDRRIAVLEAEIKRLR
jgi:hypothetical protein